MEGRLVNLTEKEPEIIARETFRKTAAIGLNHAKRNHTFIKETIKDLGKEIKNERSKPAIVISAGPRSMKNTKGLFVSLSQIQLKVDRG